MRFGWLLLLVPLTSCESLWGSFKTPTVPLTYGEAITWQYQAFCDGLFGCCNSAQRAGVFKGATPASADECVNLILMNSDLKQHISQIQAGIDKGTVRFDAQKAGSCIAQLRAAVSNCDQPFPRVLNDGVCEGMLIGMQPLGAECMSSETCAPGSGCASQAGSQRRVCTALARQGQECRDVPCERDLYCSNESKCVPKLTDGQACTGGYQCRSDECQNMRCAPATQTTRQLLCPMVKEERDMGQPVDMGPPADMATPLPWTLVKEITNLELENRFVAASSTTIYFANANNSGAAHYFRSYNVVTGVEAEESTVNDELCACGYMSKLVFANDKLYYIANTGSVYDPQTKKWSMFIDAATARRGEPATTVYRGRIYQVGGRDAGAMPFLSSVRYYDLMPMTFVSVPDHPFPISDGIAAAVGDRIYVLGGRTVGGQNSFKMTILIGNNWLMGGDHPDDPDRPSQKLFFVDAVGFRNQLWAFSYSGAAHIYDPESGKWSAGRVPGPPDPNGRWTPVVLAPDRTPELYLIGTAGIGLIKIYKYTM